MKGREHGSGGEVPFSLRCQGRFHWVGMGRRIEDYRTRPSFFADLLELSPLLRITSRGTESTVRLIHGHPWSNSSGDIRSILQGLVFL